MPFVRRSFAVLSSVFLMQLSLLGSGTLCPMHDGTARDDAGAHGGHDMGGMRSGAATRPAVSAMSDLDGPMSRADCGGAGRQDGCGLPWAPGQCLSMTACAVSATPAPRSVDSAPMRTPLLELPSPALLHSGPTFAPELPPPRA